MGGVVFEIRQSQAFYVLEHLSGPGARVQSHSLRLVSLSSPGPEVPVFLSVSPCGESLGQVTHV